MDLRLSTLADLKVMYTVAPEDKARLKCAV